MSHRDHLSMIGGAAQGGSAQPQEKREEMDRRNEQRQEESPEGADESSRGKVGGTSNDGRTDEERSGGDRTA
ncbi:MAG TPA: hypothetical protein VGD76_12140 [Ramlibacter sp.]